jgi:hypothetical protein
MSHPYAAAAANDVLRAAEAWRDDLLPGTSTAGARTTRALSEAVDRYRDAVARPQSTSADEYVIVCTRTDMAG